MSQGKPGHLKILEHANDLALVDYWKAVMLLEECEDALDATNEALAVRLAVQAERDAQNKMAKARHEYLTAKIDLEAANE